MRQRRDVAVIGAAHTPFYRRGTAPVGERALCVEAVVGACADAGIDPADVDGFVSYAADRNPGPRLTGSLGTRSIGWTSLVWGGGGGGSAGAVDQAVAALQAGRATYVAVYRASHQGDSGRLADAVNEDYFDRNYRVHGIDTPIQKLALATRRLVEVEGVPPSALEAFVQASYHHAANNPGACGRDLAFDAAAYRSARLVADPVRLLDSSRENDGAGALVLTTVERAVDLVEAPVAVLGAVHGGGPGRGHLAENHEPYALGCTRPIADRLWEQTGLSPSDVDVAQVYANMSGPAVASIVDHGFCEVEELADRFVFENLIAPGGWLPLNTSGGDIAEGFVHGMGNAVEAVRQLRGQSSNPVPGAQVCLVTGGPMAEGVLSSMLFGTLSTVG